ncbi:MAG: hypothetical protein E7582_07595 [Ruminococcaceae bacterium]|nr:hypothetical protein [Oscillospiraceae bacterium]
MYKNIGSKIKGLATIIFVIEALVSVVAGIVLLAIDEAFVWIGLIYLIGGPIVAWVSSFLLYGFGELIDKVCEIEKNTRTNNNNDTNKIVNSLPTNIAVDINKKEIVPVSQSSSNLKYNCISITSTGNESHGMCVICKSSNVNLKQSKIQTEIGVRTLDICKNCYNQFYIASTKK